MPLSSEQKATQAALIQKTTDDPRDAGGWTALGHFYFDTDQSHKAIEAYEKALSLDEKQPDVWTDLGVMYRRHGEPRKAVEAFDHALEINAGHQIALFNKGVVMMHDLNDPAGALKAWQDLLTINPEAKTPDGQSLKMLVEELGKRNPSQ